MSWLYTIVFTGLMLSSQGSSFSTVDHSIQNSPVVVVESRKGDETEKFEQTYPLTPNGRVSVSNVNGSITVEAWDRSEVKLEYTKIADTKERLADVEVKIDAKPEYFSVETDYGDWKKGNSGDRWRNGGKLSVEMRLMVPRGAFLNEIETVNGSVAVSNFTNMTKVSAVNGSVNATNLRGTARLSTVNGEVTADFDRLETGSKISLETVNGKANLVIPSDSNATVKADSLNGNITNDFGLPVRKGKYVGRDLYGRLGGGEVQIRLNSVNGGLSIGHKNDGKSLSRAVDLLPQKEKDDEDWDKDDDNDPGFQSAKINKDVAKAVKESTKVTAKAMADAEVEINKIQPEIAKITAESVNRAAEAVIVQKDTIAKMADAVFFPSIPRVEKRSESFPVKGTPKVTIDAKGCSVTVRGWDRSEVQYRVVQFSDQRDHTPLKIDESHTDSAVTIKVANPNGQTVNLSPSNRIRIEVNVPRKSNLKINAGGEIRLEGVSGDVDLTGGDESVNVRDGDGTLQVSSSDGLIRVIGFRGAVVAETSAGMINLEGDFIKLKARSNDGAIFLTLADNAQADVEATGDDLRGEGIALTRISGNEKLSKYRIGNGGASFQLETEGEIRVRGAGTLRESF